MPTSYLDDVARQYGSTCARYYMLSPMGEMMCENEAGKIVAANIPTEILVNMVRDLSFVPLAFLLRQLKWLSDEENRGR